MFGQFVLGPPGSGKTTYTHGMQQMCLALKRPYLLVNLDPGAEGSLPYGVGVDAHQAVVDVRDLIRVEEVMDTFDLGPNGALMYCMEFLEENMDLLFELMENVGRGDEEHDEVVPGLSTSCQGAGGGDQGGTSSGCSKRAASPDEDSDLESQIAALASNRSALTKKLSRVLDFRHRYVIFDCPGQVELYLHSDVMNKITKALEKKFHLRLTCVHLMDSNMLQQPGSYLSAVLTALTATMHLELPHINVLTKIDLLKDFSLDFRLDYYLDVDDLDKLLEVAREGRGHQLGGIVPGMKRGRFRR